MEALEAVLEPPVTVSVSGHCGGRRQSGVEMGERRGSEVDKTDGHGMVEIREEITFRLVFQIKLVIMHSSK